MDNATRLKYILRDLNSMDIVDDDNFQTIFELEQLLFGDLLIGISKKLGKHIAKLAQESHDLRFVDYGGCIYLIDSNDVTSYLYNGCFDDIIHYMRFNDSMVEIKDGDLYVTYDRENQEKKNSKRILMHERRVDAEISSTIYYDDEGKEYRRVENVKSLERATINYSIYYEASRGIYTSDPGEVSIYGWADIGNVGGIKGFSICQNLYTIPFDGEDFDGLFEKLQKEELFGNTLK